MLNDISVPTSTEYFSNASTTIVLDKEAIYKDKIKNLNKMVSVLSKELDLDKFDKDFKNNIEDILGEHYSDKVKDHESFINSLKSSIIECESNIDKIKNLGGIAGDELIRSYNFYKRELVSANNIKEKDL